MKKNILLILALLFITNFLFSQQTIVKKESVPSQKKNPLTGLKKAEFKDLDPSKPLMLDGISTPVYSENLTLIKGEEFMKVMSSGDFIPEVFMDKNKEVKAFVLRKATALEKSQMIEMDDNMSSRNDLQGKPAMSFQATDIFGNNYTLESLKGKVIVMNFWFVECKPCVIEMPELNKLVDKYKNSEVVFLGFATNDKSKIENFLKKTTYKYNIIPDAKEAVKSYNINAFPTHLVIDKNSTISFTAVGLGPNTIEDLDKNIESLILSADKKM